MKVGELLEVLGDQNPDLEVRLAQQPSWAMEAEVGHVVSVQIGGPDLGDRVTYEDDEGAERTGTVTDSSPDAVLVVDDSGKERPVPFYQLIGYLELADVVYIGEGTQLGYLPGVVARELGWS